MEDCTLQEILDNAPSEQWDVWEQKAAELEITVDYYVQEFI